MTEAPTNQWTGFYMIGSSVMKELIYMLMETPMEPNGFGINTS